MTIQGTCPKCRIFNAKTSHLIESWTLIGKYTPNKNITLTAEVPKLLPWVFDTGDPVPWEAWQTLLSLLVGLPAQQEIKQMLGEGWEQGTHETSSNKEQGISFHLCSPSGTSAGTATGMKQIHHRIPTCRSHTPEKVLSTHCSVCCKQMVRNLPGGLRISPMGANMWNWDRSSAAQKPPEPTLALDTGMEEGLEREGKERPQKEGDKVSGNKSKGQSKEGKERNRNKEWRQSIVWQMLLQNCHSDTHATAQPPGWMGIHW